MNGPDPARHGDLGVADECRACLRGDHHRCRRGGCACDFPVHGAYAERRNAERQAQVQAQAPEVPVAAPEQVAGPDPGPAPAQTVYVALTPSPPTVTTVVAPPAPVIWKVVETVRDVVVVERERRSPAYKRMQPALLWLIRELAERAGLDGEQWGTMVERLLLDNGWSRPAVGLVARILAEELARPGRLTVDVDIDLERIVVGALVSDRAPAGLRL